jgi:predicted DCC family thiol-disulfide oxidoreductase YuxK
MNTAPAVLLYDGECGLCARSIQFVLQRESVAQQSLLQFAALHSEFGAYVRTRHPDVANVDSIVWYETFPTGASQVRVRSDAALAVALHLGGTWRAVARLGAFVPRPLRDAVYDAIARRRLQLAAPACVVPTATQRSRFLP